ncbi:MAG: cysteine desulfurase [Kiritimatiellae bacterium]|nr:cysteine desulfurase [Kiritimatiellia bacterium]
MNKKLIYADHAATTPLMPEALEAMLPFVKGNFGNPSSIHSWARKPREAVREARAAIARCINAEPEEIFFTSGGTEADNWVVKGSEGGMLVSSYEHHAVLNVVASEARRGRDVVYVRPKVGNGGGYIMPERLSKAWKDDIGLVSVMTVNNEIGTINPVHLLSELAHKRGALFHTDAVQAVGHIPIDVREMGVDFLSASAHKFNGPKGVGFLFIRKGNKLEPLLNGGQQENGLRAGTENVASIVGMATALKMNCERMEKNTEHLEKLTALLRDGIDRIFPDAIYLGDGIAGQLPGFTSVSFPGHPAEGLLHMLDLKGIAVSTGAACDSKNVQTSHVLKAINVANEIARSTVRITFGPENTVSDVDAMLIALKRILPRCGK